ncbi:MAG: EamA family transporter [Nanoarchaeota archaeon]
MEIKKRKTGITAIGLVLISTIFTAIGQLFLKEGVDITTTLASIFNFSLIFGLVLYGIALLIVLKAFQHGELSVLYPVLALSYIWVIFFSYFFLNESLGIWKILGALTIFVGVTLIGVGSK